MFVPTELLSNPMNVYPYFLKIIMEKGHPFVNPALGKEYYK